MPARQSYLADYKVIDANHFALRVSLGRLFHSHRVAQGLNQQDLAAQVPEADRKGISNVENGEGWPAAIEALGRVLGVEEKYVRLYCALT
jgi:hypothetical protein